MLHGETVLCVYQDDNMDSFLGAWVIWKHTPNATFIKSLEGLDLSTLKERDVFVIGTTYSLGSLLDLSRYCRTLTIYGNSESFHDEANFFVTSLFPNTTVNAVSQHSLSNALWRTFKGSIAPPQPFSYIEDKELWRFKLRDTLAVTTALMSFSHNFEVWDYLLECEDIQNLIAEGKILLKRISLDIENVITSSQRRIGFCGYQVPIVNTPASIAQETGIRLSPGEYFVICYWDTATGREYVLVTTNKDINVNEIVRPFGGSGSRNQARFRVSRNHPLATF